MATQTEQTAAPSWVRYSGLLIVISALLELFTNFVAMAVFPEAFVPGTRDAVIVGSIVLSYLILGVIGVVALYVYYKDAFGWAGKLGLLSIALGAGIGAVMTAMTGEIGGDILNTFLVLFVGAGLLAVGLWRTPSIPRSAALLMGLTPVAAVIGIVGFSQSPEGFLGLLGFGVLSLVWGGAWIILGYHLWQQKPESSVTA